MALYSKLRGELWAVVQSPVEEFFKQIISSLTWVECWALARGLSWVQSYQSYQSSQSTELLNKIQSFEK